MEELKKIYRKYRWFYTSSGKLVMGGKNAEQNEFLLDRVSSSKKEHMIMHTTSPGSPFSVILTDIKKVTEQDKSECAIFTASFSQAWKKMAKKASVDIFNSSKLYKKEYMKIGTWGVAEKIGNLIVPLELAVTKQKGIIRAVPAVKIKNRKILFKIVPGSINKSAFAQKALNNKEEVEELISALPSGGIKIKNG